MRRHIRWALPGLSLVELLVTVFIATLVFAAMVPLFVGAQKKNVADNLRNIALQIAQDKIEKIRQLDFDQIVADPGDPSSVPNLYNPSFAGGQFGPTFAAVAGTTSKTIHIDYTVSDVPAGPLEGLDQCKKVVVDVWWDPPPAPVKHVILETLIYQQYAGPRIAVFDVSPLEEVASNIVWVTSSSVDLTATIVSEDLASMNAGGTPQGFVRFSVNAYNGARVAFGEVSTPVYANPGQYVFTWDASTAPDGVYVFQAVAFSLNRFQGNTVSQAYRVEKGPPAAVTNLAATAGNGVVYLTWDTSPAGDLSHYQVWRGTAAGGEVLLADGVATPSYSDETVVNDTTYYYVVKAIDELGNASPASAEVSAMPQVMSDTEAPSVPGGFAAAKNGPSQPSVRLTWTASTDTGTPASGLACYQIERSSDGVGSWTAVDGNVSPTAIAYVDASAGYDALWYYRIRAVDLAGNASAYSPASSARTDPIPTYTLTVRNSHNSSSLSVRVQSVSTGLWYRQDGTSSSSSPTPVVIKKNKAAAWSGLPAGVYTVFGSYNNGASWITKLGDISGGPTTVQFP